MSDEQFRDYIEVIWQKVSSLQKDQSQTVQEEVAVALEHLQLIFEQMQISLRATESVEKVFLQQNQRIREAYQRYYGLFQSLPIPYLVTSIEGLILEANEAIAQFLNVPRGALSGQFLTTYMVGSDRLDFRNRLGQLAQGSSPQAWQTTLCPWDLPPQVVELQIDFVRDEAGVIHELRIGVYDLRRTQLGAADVAPQQPLKFSQAGAMAMPQLPQSLDGLRVLIVDDAADAREFIIAVLESHGIQVQAVASATAAIEALEQFYPDVVVSDIQMPDMDGYELIRQIRAREKRHGKHIPAAAMTAYLEEDREKAMKAGYEAYLHKLAQPEEWVAVVTQLAGRSSE